MDNEQISRMFDNIQTAINSSGAVSPELVKELIIRQIMLQQEQMKQNHEILIMEHHMKMLEQKRKHVEWLYDMADQHCVAVEEIQRLYEKV